MSAPQTAPETGPEPAPNPGPAFEPTSRATDAAFRLRGRPPPVMRLSRPALAMAGGVAAAALGAALTVALAPRVRAPAPPPVVPVEARQPAEAVTAAPKDYGQTPRLGPPLPGDLGRPILASQARDPAAPQVSAPAAPRPPSAAPSAAASARQAALASAVLFDLGSARGARPANGPVSTDSPVAAPATTTIAASSPPAKVAPLASPYTLLAGAVIPAALITGLNSDLPGQVIAQVTADVYDTVTGTIRLIPAGTRLIGAYDARTAFGQRRIGLAWTRLTFPNGASITLSKASASDLQGYAGLSGKVDNHWSAIAKAAALSTVLSVGAELGVDDEDRLARALRQGAQDTVNQAGQQIVRRQLDVRPTLTLRPGHPLRLTLTEDLVLPPWTEVAS